MDGKIDWSLAHDQLVEIVQRGGSGAVAAGHIYRFVQSAPDNGCEGWPRLRTNRDICWWQYKELTVFVCLEEDRLVVLALAEGTRPADFDNGSRIAERHLNQLWKRK